MSKKRDKVDGESAVDYAHMRDFDGLRKAFENYGEGKIFTVTGPSPDELDSVIKFEAARRLAISAPDRFVEFRVKVAVLCVQAFGNAGGMLYSTKIKFLCYVGGEYRDLAIDCRPFVPEYGTEARQAFMETAPQVVFVASENVRHALAKPRLPSVRPSASFHGERSEDD